MQKPASEHTSALSNAKASRFCFIGIADFIMTADGPRVIELGSLHTSNFNAINELHSKHGNRSIYERVFDYLSQHYPQVRICPGPFDSVRSARNWIFSPYGDSMHDDLKEFAEKFPNTDLSSTPLDEKLKSGGLIFVWPVGEVTMGQSVQKAMYLQRTATQENITTVANFASAELMAQNKGIFTLIAERAQAAILPPGLRFDLTTFTAKTLDDYLANQSETEFVVKPFNESLGEGVFVIAKAHLASALKALASRDWIEFAVALSHTATPEEIERLKLAWTQVLTVMPYCLIQTFCRAHPLHTGTTLMRTASKGRMVYIYHNHQIVPLDLFYTVNTPSENGTVFNQDNAIVGGMAARNFGIYDPNKKPRSMLHLPSVEQTKEVYRQIIPQLQIIFNQAEKFDLQDEIISAHNNNDVAMLNFLLYTGARTALGVVDAAFTSVLNTLVLSPQRNVVTLFLSHQVIKYVFASAEAFDYQDGYSELFEFVRSNPYLMAIFRQQNTPEETSRYLSHAKEIFGKQEKVLHWLAQFEQMYSSAHTQFWAPLESDKNVTNQSSLQSFISSPM